MEEAQTSQTFARKEREQKIQVIKNSIAAYVYDFTVRKFYASASWSSDYFVAVPGRPW
jgi:hypothetical protein